MRHYIDALIRGFFYGVLAVATVVGLCVMPGLTVIVGVFAWFWWAREGDELDDEIKELLMEAAAK